MANNKEIFNIEIYSSEMEPINLSVIETKVDGKTMYQFKNDLENNTKIFKEVRDAMKYANSFYNEIGKNIQITNKKQDIEELEI